MPTPEELKNLKARNHQPESKHLVRYYDADHWFYYRRSVILIETPPGETTSLDRIPKAFYSSNQDFDVLYVFIKNTSAGSLCCYTNGGGNTLIQLGGACKDPSSFPKNFPFKNRTKLPEGLSVSEMIPLTNPTSLTNIEKLFGKLTEEHDKGVFETALASVAIKNFDGTEIEESGQTLKNHPIALLKHLHSSTQFSINSIARNILNLQCSQLSNGKITATGTCSTTVFVSPDGKNIRLESTLSNIVITDTSFMAPSETVPMDGNVILTIETPSENVKYNWASSAIKINASNSVLSKLYSPDLTLFILKQLLTSEALCFAKIQEIAWNTIERCEIEKSVEQENIASAKQLMAKTTNLAEFTSRNMVAAIKQIISIFSDNGPCKNQQIAGKLQATAMQQRQDTFGAAAAGSSTKQFAQTTVTKIEDGVIAFGAGASGSGHSVHTGHSGFAAVVETLPPDTTSKEPLQAQGTFGKIEEKAKDFMVKIGVPQGTAKQVVYWSTTAASTALFIAAAPVTLPVALGSQIKQEVAQQKEKDSAPPPPQPAPPQVAAQEKPENTQGSFARTVVPLSYNKSTKVSTERPLPQPKPSPKPPQQTLVSTAPKTEEDGSFKTKIASLEEKASIKPIPQPEPPQQTATPTPNISLSQGVKTLFSGAFKAATQIAKTPGQVFEKALDPTNVYTPGSGRPTSFH